MADVELKRRILGNAFVEHARSLRVSRGDYDDLCAALLALAGDWSGRELVEKGILQKLYLLVPVTRAAAAALALHRPDEAHLSDEMATRLDALILECLAA